MATDAQRALVWLKDPLAYGDPVAEDLDAALDLGALLLPRRLFGNAFDLAVALYACCTLRRQNPNLGAGVLTGISEGGGGGSRTKTPQNMPSWFRADWYTIPAGEELIGLVTANTPPSLG